MSTNVSDGGLSGQTIRAESFVGTLGVDMHIAYTDGGYANLANDAADLAYLDVANVRDGISNGQYGSAPLSSYITLAQSGVKFTFIVGAGGAVTTESIQAELALFDRVNTAVPGSVVAVEGTNEINNAPITFNGVGGLQGALNLQQYLYSAVHADPNLAGVSVDYFTGYNAGAVAVGPDPATTPGLADDDTQHPYPNYGEAPAAWVTPSQALGNESAVAGYGPAVYTETGYSTNGGTGGAVNADVQAKYTLDLLLDTAADNVSRTYLYQLMDAYKPGSPQGDDGFGLFDPSNAPKAAATAIHNLVSLLADGGAAAGTFVPVSLRYSVAGLPAAGNSLAIAKSDGTYDIAVWNEPSIWNEATGTEVSAATSNVTVQLAASYATVEVFDPMAGVTPIATLHDVSAVPLGLTDHPLIVQVGPAITPAAATGPVTVGSGPDSVVLDISEDAYLGNAAFTVTIDGNQIGGIQTATALHGAGATQPFTFDGTFGTGPHTITVNFLNDLYAGTPATDRNLYVDRIVANGTTQDVKAGLLGGGPVAFSAAAASTGTTPVPVAPAPVTTAPITIGSGPDTLALNVSEDAYQGDAQFTIAVDGTQIGGIQTARASHATGADQTFNVLGTFARNSIATMTFLNDAYAGTPATDRNLYLDQSSIDGTPIAHGTLTELEQGPQSFAFQNLAAPSLIASTPLVLHLAEDAYKGDAQFTVSIDGNAASAPQTVSASHAAGLSQAFNLAALAAGAHDIAVSFVNDLYDGTPMTDRNLYVTGIDVGGVAAPNATASILSNGTSHFTISVSH